MGSISVSYPAVTASRDARELPHSIELVPGGGPDQS